MHIFYSLCYYCSVMKYFYVYIEITCRVSARDISCRPPRCRHRHPLPGEMLFTLLKNIWNNFVKLWEFSSVLNRRRFNSVKLFLTKWENESKRETFLTYFKKQLLWWETYQGYLALIPYHNNNNEADNR